MYSTEALMTSYVWVVSAGGIVTAGGGSTSNSVTVTWTTAGAQTVSVNYTNSSGCSAPSPTVYNVTVNPTPVPTITGPATACLNLTGNVYTTQAGMTNYNWLVTGGTVTGGGSTNSITVTWNTAGAQTVSVNYTNASGCQALSPTIYNVTVNPLPVPTLSGPATVCTGTAGNVYTTQPGMTAYVWSVSAGGIVTAGGTSSSNAVTVTWTTAGAQTVSVNYTNSSGCSAPSPTVYNVTVNPTPVPTITGQATACINSTGNVYNTQAGMTAYSWIVTGGTISAGAGTSAITVTWNTAGPKTVSVNYTNGSGCSAASPTVFNVTVNPLPVPTITGPTSLCANSGYANYVTEAGNILYVWTVSAGGLITTGQGTNSIQVFWGTTGAQTVSVSYSLPSGCSAATPTQVNVTVNASPGAAGSITGSSAVCAGSTGVSYSVAPVTNALSYAWTLPAGVSITAGQYTNNITVTFATNASSGSITVSGNNLCGNGPSSPAFHVTVNAVPSTAGAIAGKSRVCQGESGVLYSVAPITNATGYVWTLPVGASISSGANTSTITVNFLNTAQSGYFKVYGTNSCGNGNSSQLLVTVGSAPPSPIINNSKDNMGLKVGDILTSSATEGNQWYLDGQAIPGATGETLVTPSIGTYFTIATEGVCSSDTSNFVYVGLTGIEEIGSTTFLVYPVPNFGLFTARIVSSSHEFYRIKIYNTLGVMVYEGKQFEVSGQHEEKVDVRHLASGIYSVVFINDQTKVVRKIFINK